MRSQSNPYNVTAICYANIALFTKLDYYASNVKSCMGKYLAKIICGEKKESLDRWYMFLVS